MRDAIDFSYARPTPDEVAQHNLDILVYTGPARPDQAYLTAMRQAGVAVTLVQESDPNRSQQGYTAGATDAVYADQRADEVGYPRSAAIAYVVSDGNANVPNTGAASIAAYAKGIADTSLRPFFFYGNQYACDAARQGAPQALGSWIPSTWGTATLLRQEANIASPIADTDLNTVHQSYQAWGQTAPTPVPPQTFGEDMVLYTTTDDGKTTYYRDASGILVALRPEEAAPYFKGLTEGWVHLVPLGGFLSALAYNHNTVEALKKAGV